jgi:hypothetical protein
MFVILLEARTEIMYKVHKKKPHDIFFSHWKKYFRSSRGATSPFSIPKALAIFP